MPFMNGAKKILIIEDDTDIRELISLQLRMKAHLCFEASTASEAQELIKKESFDLFLIDRMLPDSSGTQICQELRRSDKTNRAAIILITAMAEPENIIEGLDAGADDYITKPFDIDVLQARVRAQLRRHSPSARPSTPKEVLKAGSLVIDHKRRKVEGPNGEIKLTHTEYQILHELAQNPGLVYKRRDLIEKILGGDVHVTNRTIDTHIAGLRKKLSDDSSLIETIRGVGYRFQESGE